MLFCPKWYILVITSNRNASGFCLKMEKIPDLQRAGGRREKNGVSCECSRQLLKQPRAPAVKRRRGASAFFEQALGRPRA